MSEKIKTNPEEKVEEAKKIAEKNLKNNSAYESLEDSIFKLFRWLSTLIDHLFFSGRYTAVFALVCALVCYFVVNYNEDSFTNSLSSSRTLNNVSISTRYNTESFEVSGLPSNCSVVLTGEAANVNNAATRNGYCLINLEGYTEGTHLVSLKAVGYGDSVNAVVTPSEAQVTLKKKTTLTFDLNYDFINSNQLDSRFILGTPVFEAGNKVNIRASQDTLNSIALVKALIDVSGQSGDFVIDAPLVAYDRNGQVVNAEIVPASVKVEVPITSPHKSVPIVLNLTGEIQNGFAIEKIEMDHSSTEIYAPEKILNSINEVYVNLDVATLTSDTTIIQPVTLPSGVNGADVTMVNIKAILSLAASKEIANVPIVYRNNDNGFGAKDVDVTSVTVTVTGSETNIEGLKADDIVVYIDVAGLEAGSYTLPLNVELKSTAVDKYVTLDLDRWNLNITLVSKE